MKFNVLHEIKTKEEAAPVKVINRILRSRSITDSKAFISPPSPRTLSLTDFDKTYKKQFSKVTALLEKIRTNDKMIIVYTDYDADGITGGAILWETLHLLGFNARPYVPHRVHEGYGFSIKGIDAVKKEFDPALIISVDHGISAREQIAYAVSAGIPVVITDHHLKPEKIPDTATAIFHIPLLSGSGVAYVFSKSVYEHFKDTVELSAAKRELLENHFEVDYAALAAVGTIADLVPLIGPSRSIVAHGLKAFSTMKRVGMKELLRSAGIEGKPVTPYEVGFMIAPRINAIGRLEHAIDALRLLCTASLEKAAALTSHIGSKNTERQELVKTAVSEADGIIKKKYGDKIPKLLVLVSDHWHEGIIGLVASKMTESYFRPTIVMTRADGYYKGSARSIPSFHMTDFLRSHKELLISVGGHAQAAGFSIEKGKLKRFTERVISKAEKNIKKRDLERSITVDISIPSKLLSIDLAQHLEQLTPFGIGNPRPVFMSTVEIAEAKILGKDGSHLKFTDSNGIEFIYFGHGKDEELSFLNGSRNVVYTCEINRWNGNSRLQAKVAFMEREKSGTISP